MKLPRAIRAASMPAIEPKRLLVCFIVLFFSAMGCDVRRYGRLRARLAKYPKINFDAVYRTFLLPTNNRMDDRPVPAAGLALLPFWSPLI